jgi:hypothetical protein
MHEAVERHLMRLRLLCAAFLSSIAAYGTIVLALGPPTPPPLTQGVHLVWVVLVIALVNLVTLMPVYRAMLTGPRRVFRYSHEVQPLLNAHLTAHVVAFCRIEAISVLGLALFFAAGREDWFWVFSGTAAVGMLVLWPVREKIEAHLSETVTPS